MSMVKSSDTIRCVLVEDEIKTRSSVLQHLGNFAFYI